MFGLDRQNPFGVDHRVSEQERVATLKAEVAALQARLASDIGGLDAAGDAGCRQALADAAERQGVAKDLVARAGTAGELGVARQVVIEGLTATRYVRQKQGLPLGADLPGPDIAPPAGPMSVVRPQGIDASAGGVTPFWKRAAGIGGAALAGGMIGNALGGVFSDGQGGDGWGGECGGGDFGGGDG